MSCCPAAQAFTPHAVVITCGTDALDGDPLSRLALSNGALWSAVERLVEPIGPAVVLGGGGYNPWTLARCWTGLWGRLSGRDIPATLPPAAQRILADLQCDLVDDEDVKRGVVHDAGRFAERGTGAQGRTGPRGPGTRETEAA